MADSNDSKKTENEASGPTTGGLTAQQANEALKQFGKNEIQREKQRPAWVLFFEQFKSPLVVILVFACIISVVLGEVIEAVAIGAILVLNSVIGFFQEFRAENAIQALQEMTAPRARVLRDSHQLLIHAHEVVPGDRLLLETGDIVAADAEILEASHFQVNEAVLTGESLPVAKDMSEEGRKVFMGTSVVAGVASTRVLATGMMTELGKIAHLIASATSEPTPLQQQLARVGKTLLMISLGVVGVVAILGLFMGLSWLEVMIFSLSLAVAAVPEGMPAIVTVALALGVQRLAARNALMRKLPSVETLGSVSVICTDKTGTLTTGNMRVREVWGQDHNEIIKSAASCCDAEVAADSMTGMGDPTEVAILLDARERGIKKELIETTNPRVSMLPFDADRRRMSIFRQDGCNYVKGALESLLPLCDLSAVEKERALKTTAEMSSRGLRVLAIATGQRPEESQLTLLGLVGIADPPRSEATQAIAEARAAGITPVMITGDHPGTAQAIARELGLVLEGESFEERVHARATPEDKLLLVREWKARGAIVAMTGDGVNDAPALREAHIGIAMGQAGTEVTRQSADMILADDNFATIVAAVKEGRGIYQNIRKALTYLLIGNFAELFIVFGALAIGWPLPLVAAQLLWINLVTDALPALTLVTDPVSPDLMRSPPRPAAEQIMGQAEWRQVFIVGLLEAVVMLVLYYFLLGQYSEVEARGFVFSALVMSQILRAFGARSSTLVFWQVGVFSNLWLLGVAALTGILQLSLHYFPFTQQIFGLRALTLSEILLILPVSLIPISLIELWKLLCAVQRGRPATP